MKTLTKMLCGLALSCTLGLGWLTTSSRAANPSAMNKIAPELKGGQWLNTGGKAITLEARKGKVTLVEYWTFACSNCQANLPSYARLYENFKGQGVEIIGIHTPEFDYEADPKNVARRVKELKIAYPILIDSKSENWNRWEQKYWPTVYLVDKAGRIRYQWIGELESNNAGGEAKISDLIETLLNEEAPEAMKVSTQAHAETSPQLSDAQLKTAMDEPVGKVVKTDAEWKKILTPDQYYILREEGTERAFSGDYKSHGAGIYRCAACGLSLFDAKTKFDSGTGWPSFYQSLAKTHVKETTDADGDRTEVECARCGGHLGHVFDDGPKPTGLRYCMNSPALKFEPVKFEKASSQKSAPQVATLQKANFAGGCFWSMEAIFEQLKGVSKVDPGYAGGSAKNPTYEQVGTGKTGYAETLDITFDPNVISYRDLLEVLFTVHDPTTPNKQGADEGTQYRSIIFYRSPEQKSEAEAAIKKFTDDKIWSNPIVTQVQPIDVFYCGEDYHLDYFTKNPEKSYCKAVIVPKVAKFRATFKDKLKS
jgi:peptide methionine sulfoxide reductase msrA/msrB